GRLTIVTRRGPVDTVVSLAAPSAPFVVGAPGVFKATVRNLGTAATSATATVDFGRAFGSAAGTGWTCDNLSSCSRTAPIPAGRAPPRHPIPPLPTGRFGLTAPPPGPTPFPSTTPFRSGRLTIVTRRGPVDTVVSLAAPSAPFVVGAPGVFKATVRNLGTAAT